MSLCKISSFLVLAFGFLSFHVLAADGETIYGSGTHRFALATGSQGELGLLQRLAEEFARGHDAHMDATAMAKASTMTLPTLGNSITGIGAHHENQRA